MVELNNSSWENDPAQLAAMPKIYLFLSHGIANKGTDHLPDFLIFIYLCNLMS